MELCRNIFQNREVQRRLRVRGNDALLNFIMCDSEIVGAPRRVPVGRVEVPAHGTRPVSAVRLVAHSGSNREAPAGEEVGAAADASKPYGLSQRDAAAKSYGA